MGRRHRIKLTKRELLRRQRETIKKNRLRKWKHLSKPRLKGMFAQDTTKNLRLKNDASGTGTSSANERPSSSLSDDFAWPETENGQDGDQKDEKKSIKKPEIPEIEEVKIEAPEEVDLGSDVVEPEPDDLGTILGRDGGRSEGFKPFIRASRENLPSINMFAVMQFVATNDHYSTMDYEILKELVTPTTDHKLISGLRVQRRDATYRVRCHVHLDTSAMCGIEYDVDTHTVTRSECMACPLATCPHAAALLFWLHAASNAKDNKFDPKLLPNDLYKPKPKPKRQALKRQRERVLVVSAAAPAPRGGGGGEVLWAEPHDPLQVAEPASAPPPQPLPPSAAKRVKRNEGPGEGSAVAPPTRPKVPKSDDTAKRIEQKDESVVKCSFTRKCFYNVWRSTTGNFIEKLRHTRSVMSKAFHDDRYVIDFLPLERRLEELCVEIEGYSGNANNKEGFEQTHSEWFEAVENMDLRKTKKIVEFRKNDIHPGSSAQLEAPGDWGGGIFT